MGGKRWDADGAVGGDNNRNDDARRKRILLAAGEGASSEANSSVREDGEIGGGGVDAKEFGGGVSGGAQGRGQGGVEVPACRLGEGVRGDCDEVGRSFDKEPGDGQGGIVVEKVAKETSCGADSGRLESGSSRAEHAILGGGGDDDNGGRQRQLANGRRESSEAEDDDDDEEDHHALLLTPEEDRGGFLSDDDGEDNGGLAEDGDDEQKKNGASSSGEGLVRGSKAAGATANHESSEAARRESAERAAEVELQKHRLAPLFNGCRSVTCFKKKNKISEGTYGAVYRAEDLETREIVALKLVKYHQKVWAEGFPMPALREIAILLELNHPNVIDVKEIVVGSKDTQVFMVMEYVEHELRYLLSCSKPEFSAAEKKCLLKQLLEAVAFLHSHWVTHRDLKTSNLLYSNQGVLKVCDFGMSRKFGEPIKPYTRNVVTAWYRAPELFVPFRDYNEKTDIWSVGCIFAEILLGKPIFDGKNELEVLQKIFEVTGSPTLESWPDWFPACGKLFNLPHREPSWRKIFPPVQTHFSAGAGSISPDGLDLLQKLLELNPARRISAREALAHPYLTREKPSPTKTAFMPTVPDTNSDVRKSKAPQSVNEEEFKARDNFFDVGGRFEGRIDARRYLRKLEQAAQLAAG